MNIGETHGKYRREQVQYKKKQGEYMGDHGEHMRNWVSM